MMMMMSREVFKVSKSKGHKVHEDFSQESPADWRLSSKWRMHNICSQAVSVLHQNEGGVGKSMPDARLGQPKRFPET